jgi:hypothetical protein
MKFYAVNLADFDGGMVNRISYTYHRTLESALEELEKNKVKTYSSGEKYYQSGWKITDAKQGRWDKNEGEDVYGLPSRKKIKSDIWVNYDYHPSLLFVTEEEMS